MEVPCQHESRRKVAVQPYWLDILPSEHIVHADSLEQVGRVLDALVRYTCEIITDLSSVSPCSYSFTHKSAAGKSEKGGGYEGLGTNNLSSN